MMPDAGFRAPPDVSLAAPAGVAPWFDIALGTAAPGHVAANNRLYLLRDHAPFDAWTDAQYRDWQPLREADLLQVTTAGESPSEKTPGRLVHRTGQRRGHHRRAGR